MQPQSLPENPQAQVVLKGVGKRYPQARSHALQDINLEIKPGEIFGIIGRSGAGKSSLLRLLNGLEVPSQGEVWVDGKDISALKAGELQALRRRVGMIFQHFNLITVKTVWDNVALPLRLAGRPAVEQDRRVREVLRLVGLEGKEKAYPTQLSGGEKQRVGIARALVSEPDLLLCDEATSALDPESTHAVLALLREINQRLGLTIVLITHEMDVIRAICHRVLVLDRGRAVEQGEVWQVFGHPHHAVTRQLLRHDLDAQRSELQPASRPEMVQDAPDEMVLRLRFTGARHLRPQLSALASELGADARLLHSRLERIQNRTIGEWLVSVPADAAGLPATLERLRQWVDIAEVLESEKAPASVTTADLHH